MTPQALLDLLLGGAQLLPTIAQVASRDRIFLEVVERGAGYTGFGAVNAPVRMAAQRREVPS